jgi:hypothetical protein
MRQEGFGKLKKENRMTCSGIKSATILLVAPQPTTLPRASQTYQYKILFKFHYLALQLFHE